MTNAAISDEFYRCPRDLSVTPVSLRRILLVGSCLLEGWQHVFAGADPSCESDYILFNNVGELPPQPPQPVDDYDFQVVQVSLRSVLSEGAYFRLRYDDCAAYEALFDATRERLAQSLTGALRWNREHGLLTFVCNFLVPQQNPMGRLLPRYDLRNLVYFVERLNEELAREVASFSNAYVLDLDQIVSTYGRRHFQDDMVWHGNHASALSDVDFELDQDRLEPLLPMSQIYPVRTSEYLMCCWNELIALYRTVRQTDAVKLVIVDLDDTVWRGVMAERSELSTGLLEGWPLGFIEALCFLKRRGILLAIVSKNDELRVTDIWMRLIGGHRLDLGDFAVKKINWLPKAENIEEILREVNVLPRSVVFIDDNPVEREAVVAAFPQIRAFGPNPYLWRRLLLWSAETQLPQISSESSNRTAMVQGQIERESVRRQLSRADFLATLGVGIDLFDVTSVQAEQFSRAFELINKTNQFNTTGRRWTPVECDAFFSAGGHFFAFSAHDRFTDYGLIGVLIVGGETIEQFVMSCRVIGLDIEIAALGEVLRWFAARNVVAVGARFRETDANLLCRDVYARCGFDVAEGGFERATAVLPEPPAHVQITNHGTSPILEGVR